MTKAGKPEGGMSRQAVEDLLDQWPLIIRLQAWLRGAVFRWRQRAARAAEEE